MGFYVFSIHVPLSFGGLSAAAKILHQPVLDPQTEVRIPFVMLKVTNGTYLITHNKVLVMLNDCGPIALKFEDVSFCIKSILEGII